MLNTLLNSIRLSESLLAFHKRTQTVILIAHPGVFRSYQGAAEGHVVELDREGRGVDVVVTELIGLLVLVSVQW